MRALFDIGGTKTRIALSEDGTSFRNEPSIVDTPEGLEELVSLMGEHVRHAAGGAALQKAVGGIAGPFDRRKGMLIEPAGKARYTLERFSEQPIRELLERELGVPVSMENDAVLVGLGEMHHGAGDTSGIGAYITVSTGVGGARYVGGVLDRRAISFEPGHQIIDAGKALCPDCTGGTLQEYVSGGATEERLDKKAYEIPQDDPLWDQYARFLAVGLNNVIVHWSPDFIVLGGSMIVGDPKIPFELVQQYLK